MRRTERKEVPQGSPTAELARLVRDASKTSDRGLAIALVSAADKQAFIGAAIRSLAEHGSPPDVIVLCVGDA